MVNTTEGRRKIRAEALAELRRAIGETKPPAGKPQAWVTEFTRGVAALSRLLDNQIAQAEGRVLRRRRHGGGGTSAGTGGTGPGSTGGGGRPRPRA